MTNPQPPQPPAPPSPPPVVDPPKPPDNSAEIDRLKAENEQVKQQLAQLIQDRDKNKTAADSTQALLDQLAKIIDPDKGKLDPDKLAKDIADRDKAIADRDAKLKNLQLESEVRTLAKEHTDALLDSRTFMREAEELDQSDAKFTDTLKALVEKHKPKIATRSPGADHSGSGNGNEYKYTREELAVMLKNDPTQVNKLRAEGKLNHLLGVK